MRNTAETGEYGIRVDMNTTTGAYRVSSLIFGKQREITIPLTKDPNFITVARIHTHKDNDPRPSATDRTNADYNHTLSYVRTSHGLKLYNPENPKDASGRERIVEADCPR